MSTSSPTERRSPAADLFQIPHSRMKELVEAHLTKVREIKSFSVAPEDLLQAVYEAMWELKSHEYIENHFIMDRLKERLQAKRVSASAHEFAVKKTFKTDAAAIDHIPISHYKCIHFQPSIPFSFS